MGSAGTPGPDPPPSRPRPRAQRWHHRCPGGWTVRRRPGWAPGARPPERSPGPPCRCWGHPRARSAGTRSAAEVRPGALHRGPPPPPRSSPSRPLAVPRGQVGRTQASTGFGDRSQANSVNSPAIRSEKRSGPFWSQCFCRRQWGDGICVGQEGRDTESGVYGNGGAEVPFSVCVVLASKTEAGDGAGRMGKF